MQPTIQRGQLFWASCLALLVTSLSFGIRAGILGELGTKFGLNASQLGTIAATAFWGFPLAVIIGGMVVDIIGMKKLLLLAVPFGGYRINCVCRWLLVPVPFYLINRYCQRYC
jgi:MFS family permease